MNEILQTIFGNNAEILGGISMIVFGLSTWGVSKFIKNKAIQQAITKVSSFITSDMSIEDKTELTKILKKFITKKQIKALVKLGDFIETLDIEKVTMYSQVGLTLLKGITTTMIDNGAFDNNPQLKEQVESALENIA